MVVEFSVEEELRIEQQSRTVLQCDDSKEVAKLCSSLVKQNAYLSQLVRQATGHISELELKIALDELEETDPKTAAMARSLFESCSSGPIHLDDTQDQSLFVRLLVIALSPVVWLAGAVVGLLVIAMQTMSRVIRGLGF